MVKVKQERSADCVVAGVRPGASGVVSSLLLGLWAPDGRLHHPGVVSSPPKAVKAALAAQLSDLVVDLEQHPWSGGFGLEGGATGRLKGAGGRWLPGMTQDWVPTRPVLVAEVAYDRVDGLRFRHPARFRRWRPDRDASTCLLDQLVTGR
jgi:ATP-dependent DNA ligase